MDSQKVAPYMSSLNQYHLDDSDKEKFPYSRIAQDLFKKLHCEITEKLIDEWSNQEQGSLFNEQVVNRFLPNSPGTRCLIKTQVDGNANAIHANHVEFKQNKGPSFICSQAPTEQSVASFWRSVMDHSSCIIDLTNLKDDIDPYYPLSTSNPKTFEEMEVRSVEQRNENLFSVWHLTLRLKDQTKSVQRIHFQDWPDFGVIEVNQFEDLLTALDFAIENIEEKVWIHCRAGIGRTGTIVIGMMIKRIHAEGKLSKENYLQVIQDLIWEGRTQRDLGFVQNSHQYQLLLEFAEKLLTS